MVTATEAARMLAASLRAPVPLDEALAAAALTLQGALAVDGAALIVRRDGRPVRGAAGTLGDDAHSVRLADVEVDGTLLVSGTPALELEPLALVATLALAARFLGESAQTDGLTGVLNRRTFEARLREEWQRAAREGAPLALAILDIDFFKIYNDRRGHLAGDDALRRVAHAASATLQRASDRFARYGGEEFVAILPATPLEGAIAAAERMREAVAALAIQHPVGKAGRLTVSIGVAVAHPAEHGSPQDLVAAADRELYRAKAEGRDRVAADGYATQQRADDAFPQPFSALVGRDTELGLVVRALDDRDKRLVTITGSAGVGKTRLALAVAREVAERYAHVRFVDVLGAVDCDDVTARMRAAITGDGPTLLVLDGCERVAGACGEAIEAVAGQFEPALRVLATSRVPLGVRDERVVRIQPLDVDAARALFAYRAQAAGVICELDDPATAALLRRLAGSPLAIELAVTRLATTSAEELIDDVGAAPPGDDAARATLGSLLATALRSLDRDQAVALSAVSAFAGSFSAVDAAAVMPLSGIDERRADALLRSIVERSLLDAASHDGVTRWRMMDPVRDVALADPAMRAARDHAVLAHLRWCRARFAALEARHGSVTNRTMLAGIERFADEFRAALDRALRDERLLAEGVELCIEAARHWFAVGHVGEGRARCEAFLDRVAAGEPLPRVKLLTSAARLAFNDGDLDAMESYARAADTLLGDADRTERSPILNFLGIAAKFRGEHERAEACFRAGKELNARHGHRRGEAVAIGALGSIAMDVRLDFPVAVAYFRDSATMFRELEDDLNAVLMQGNVAEALAAQGDLDTAASLMRAALDEARGFGNRNVLVHELCIFALVFGLLRQPQAAAGALREAFELLAITPHDEQLVMAYDFCARLAASCEDDVLAASLLGTAEARAAERAMPPLPIQRFWREPLEQSLFRRLGPTAFAEALAHGRSASDAEARTHIVAFLETLAVARPAV